MINIVVSVQATASQKDEADKVESLEQQVPQAMASKVPVEMQHNGAQLNRKQPKVCRICIIQPVHLGKF